MDGFLPRPTTGQKHQPPMQTCCRFISRGGMPCMQSAIVLWQIRPSVRSSFIIFNQSIISIYCSKYMVKRINVNVTQYNVSRTERLKSTNSCPGKKTKMKKRSETQTLHARWLSQTHRQDLLQHTVPQLASTHCNKFFKNI